MLQTSTEFSSGSSQVKPYVKLLSKRNQFYEDILPRKDRTMPSMQQVIHTDMERMKNNKLYDRRLNRDLNGPKGLTWQCQQELQRLRDDERLIERDLMRLNRDIAKTTSLPALYRSPVASRSQSIRLSAIAEERSSLSIFEQPKTPLKRTSSIRSKYLIPISKRTTLTTDSSHVFPKQSFQQLIAKTSDDRILHQTSKFKQQFLH